MATRSFTLQDAQMLLPTLESLLRTAINSKKLIEEVDTELQEVAHRVFLNGARLSTWWKSPPQGRARTRRPARQRRHRGNPRHRRSGQGHRYRTARFPLQG